jgi:hypothetical protein
MRTVIGATAATLLVAGIGLFVAARLAPTPVAPVRVGPCDVQAVDATVGDCGVDPRLASLQNQLSQPPFSAWSCFRPAPASPRPRVEVLGRRDARLHLRVKLDRLTSTVNARDGDAILVADGRHDKQLRLYALTCKKPQ